MTNETDQNTQGGGRQRTIEDTEYVPLEDYSLARGLRWSWMNYRLMMIIPGIIIMIVSALIMFLGSIFTPTTIEFSINHDGSTWSVFFLYTPPPFDLKTIIFFIVSYYISVNVTLIFQNATLAGSIAVADGEPATLRRFLMPKNFKVMLGVTTWLCIALIVGGILFIIPGLIALYFMQFALPASLADENPTVKGSIKKSFALVKAHRWASFLTILTVVALIILGYLLFYVGIVVTGPLASLFLAYSYFSLTGRDIYSVPTEDTVPLNNDAN